MIDVQMYTLSKDLRVDSMTEKLRAELLKVAHPAESQLEVLSLLGECSPQEARAYLAGFQSAAQVGPKQRY